jgi:uncharacterized membrane protein
MSFDDMPRGGERQWQAEGYLVAIAYDEEPKAGEMIYLLRDLEKSGDIVLTDAVGLACDAEGKVRIFETADQQTGHDARKGALWGLVVGALFAVPVVGVAVGAGVGAFASRATDNGITKEFQKRVAERLKPGTSAVLVLGHSANREKVAEAIKPLGGTVIQTDLPPDAMQLLKETLEPEAPTEPESPPGA